jgi:hypothetical protein
MSLGPTTALVARITLAAAFGLSAASKAAHPAAFAEGLKEFGVPRSRAVALALPLVEAGLAVLLVTVRDTAWPAFLAIAVLAVFTGAVVANLVGGHPAPCPCFGPPGDGARPVSAATVARNGYFVALAVLGTGSTTSASGPATLVGAVLLGAVTLVALRRVN